MTLLNINLSPLNQYNNKFEIFCISTVPLIWAIITVWWKTENCDTCIQYTLEFLFFLNFQVTEKREIALHCDYS